MEDLTGRFQDFLIKVILPQKAGYSGWITENNIASRLNEIREQYREAFGGNDPFSADPSDIGSHVAELKRDMKRTGDTPFGVYNEKAGSGIPKALLNTHFVKFIGNYNRVVVFSDFQEIVNVLHDIIGVSFCQRFQRERIEFNGNSRTANNNIIFGGVRGNHWTINSGSEKEIQYHMSFGGGQIRYGLAFNAQPSMNNTNPVDTVRPFIRSFFFNKARITEILPDYDFVGNDENVLKNMTNGAFVCFGKTVPLEKDIDGKCRVYGLQLLEMAYDMQNKQYEAYQLIFGGGIGLNEVKNEAMMEIGILKYKHQVILQGAPGTGKTYSARNMAEQMIYGNVSPDKKEQAKRLESSEQYKLVQFHPSYMYEDFVRGIVINSDSGELEYVTQNKILGRFAEEARVNFEGSRKNSGQVSREQWLDIQFEKFVDFIDDGIQKSGYYPITDSIHILDMETDAFRYKGDSWGSKKGNKMYFKDIKQAYLDDNHVRQDIKKNKNLSGLAHHHASYYIRVLDMFKDYLSGEGLVYRENGEAIIKLQDYVLVIDEINRANLSSVLGELIYALEYREEKVESMYAVDGDNGLVLPPNLYIIGTMNTADRSVGQIDYAIRRRFAFIDVLPKVLGHVEGFDIELFKQVSALFIRNVDEYVGDATVKLERSEYLSGEFRPEDVWLGHSYFIMKDGEGKDIRDIRLNYEIKPILKEYLKDGIFKANAGNKINDLR